jgi:hypothetical protein
MRAYLMLCLLAVALLCAASGATALERDDGVTHPHDGPAASATSANQDSDGSDEVPPTILDLSELQLFEGGEEWWQRYDPPPGAQEQRITVDDRIPAEVRGRDTPPNTIMVTLTGLRTVYCFDPLQDAWMVYLDVVLEGPCCDVHEFAATLHSRCGAAPDRIVRFWDSNHQPVNVSPPLRQRDTPLADSMLGPSHSLLKLSDHRKQEHGREDIVVVEPLSIALVSKPQPGSYYVQLDREYIQRCFEQRTRNHRSSLWNIIIQDEQVEPVLLTLEYARLMLDEDAAVMPAPAPVHEMHHDSQNDD